jgi:hypothetical protein
MLEIIHLPKTLLSMKKVANFNAYPATCGAEKTRTRH